MYNQQRTDFVKNALTDEEKLSYAKNAHPSEYYVVLELEDACTDERIKRELHSIGVRLHHLDEIPDVYDYEE